MANSWMPQKYNFDNFFKFSTINNSDTSSSENSSNIPMLNDENNNEVSSGKNSSNKSMLCNENKNEVLSCENLINMSMLYNKNNDDDASPSENSSNKSMVCNENNNDVSSCENSSDTSELCSENNEVSSSKNSSNIPMLNNENNVAFSEKLSDLSLLYDVPFSYLVPSENMLKLNEIRFFYLDSNWIRTLIDGASSIGRNASIDYSNDIEFLDEIYNQAISRNVNVRRQLQCKIGMEECNIDLPCTGFLLRSQLVGGWRGMEFIAYSDTEGYNPLKVLRLEALSSEILIGIYSGEIARLDIKEPPEGFHYGFDNNNGKLEKSLRSLDDGQIIKRVHDQSIKDADGKSIKDASDQIIKDGSAQSIKDVNNQIIKDANNQNITGDYNEETIISLKERGNRVIDFSDAANKIKQELFPDSEEKPNSAHIALEMIQEHYMLNIQQK